MNRVCLWVALFSLVSNWALAIDPGSYVISCSQKSRDNSVTPGRGYVLNVGKDGKAELMVGMEKEVSRIEVDSVSVQANEEGDGFVLQAKFRCKGLSGSSGGTRSEWTSVHHLVLEYNSGGLATGAEIEEGKGATYVEASIQRLPGAKK